MNLDDLPNDLATHAMQLSAQIQPLLHGHDPRVMGCCLADLVSLYFAGHHPASREEAIAHWLHCMRGLIEPSERQIAERYGGRLPDGW